MTMIVTVIRLRGSGLMARFDDNGLLVEWVSDVGQASYFEDAHAAKAAIEGICAPEVRAAIRSGYAERVRDEDTGEEMIVVASDPNLRPLPRPMIRLDYGPRYCFDDPLRDPIELRADANRTRSLVRSLFADAARLNWKNQTEARLGPRNAISDEYRTPASVRTKRAGALAKYTGGSRRAKLVTMAGALPAA